MFSTVEEKQADVNIALRLFELPVQGRYHKAVIVTGDTHLLPAVKAVQRTFPAKRLTGYVTTRATSALTSLFRAELAGLGRRRQALSGSPWG